MLLRTGLVSVGPMECANHQSNTVGLCVISEETSKMLMVHRILQDDSYNRQGPGPKRQQQHSSRQQQPLSGCSLLHWKAC